MDMEDSGISAAVLIVKCGNWDVYYFSLTGFWPLLSLFLVFFIPMEVLGETLSCSSIRSWDA